jgi:hypothetical protein
VNRAGATDIAARGIHVDDVALVVHVDPSTEYKAYPHRSGRTARAGAGGTVVTLMTDDQVSDDRRRQQGCLLVGCRGRLAGVIEHPSAVSLLWLPDRVHDLPALFLDR